VENNRPTRTRDRAGRGPAPAADRPPLSPSRSALLETLKAQVEPVTLVALAQATGLHQNTVREHLDALVAQGLAAREPAPPAGRGRPAWLYRATATRHGDSEYAGLTAALAGAIHRTSAQPVDDAVAAGRSWGHELAHQRQSRPASTAVEARRQVVELLDDLGFAPETDARARSVRLTRCPLLEAAHRYPDVVCGVHLGLAQGALEQYGADPDRARLLPFAEAGACRLHLDRSAR